MERRFFQRFDVQANGELLWATKSRFGKVTNHRAFVATENLSVDGARLVLFGDHELPSGSRARLKLGLEFADVEILGEHNAATERTILRAMFISPSAAFVRAIEEQLSLPTIGVREEFESSWTGLEL